MSPPQTTQLSLIADARVDYPAFCRELIGRVFFDGRAYVRVVGPCSRNAGQVLLEREIDGKRWTVPAGLLRMIMGSTRKNARLK